MGDDRGAEQLRALTTAVRAPKLRRDGPTHADRPQARSSAPRPLDGQLDIWGAEQGRISVDFQKQEAAGVECADAPVPLPAGQDDPVMDEYTPADALPAPEAR